MLSGTVHRTEFHVGAHGPTDTALAALRLAPIAGERTKVDAAQRRSTDSLISDHGRRHRK